MAADRQRLAQALAAEAARRKMFESIPEAAGQGLSQAPERPMGWNDYLENLSIGLGRGAVNNLEGVKSAITSPIETAKGFATGVVEAVRNPRMVAEALKQTGQRAMSGPLGLGEVIGENVNMMRVPGKPVMHEMDVYHGSPHKFEAFDASKIGTGEGAQAYGHGIYLAESPDVARDYQNRLAYDPEKMKIGGQQINKVYDQINNAAARMSPERAAAEYEKLDLVERLMMKNSVEEVAKAAAEMSPATQKWFETKVQPSFETYGSFYKADLPDEMIGRMLDWDASIKSQPEQIRKAVEPLMNKYGVARTADIGTLISAMERDMPQSMVSEKLREAGIPGIKYLDAGSRGTSGTGTRNFVVFPGEEQNVKILERNGKKLADVMQRNALASQAVEVDLHPKRAQPDVLYLSKIAVPEGMRGQGLGTKAMQDMVKMADTEGKTITLSPSTEYGATSVSRLKDFYKRFGFVENKGRNKDYSISESMYRRPQTEE